MTGLMKVESRDGTPIACHVGGSGPPLVLVHGTGGSAARWEPLRPALEGRFTVYAMDRRGRGASGDTEPYAIEREYEDVAAVVDAIDEPVNLLGHSYGALCSLEAALRTANLRKLVLYEPVLGSVSYEPAERELLEAQLAQRDRLEALLAAGDREGVLLTFLREVVGMSDPEIEMMRSSPVAWEARLAAAHTIPREFADAEYVFEAERFRDLRVPVLLLQGGESPAFLKASTEVLERALPDARVAVLEGQRHIAMNTAPELFLDAVLGFLLS